MLLKDIIKKTQRAFARWLLYFFCWIFSWVPYSFVHLIAKEVLAIGSQLVIRQRKIARQSLRLAFGDEKDPQEIDRIFHQCFENLGHGLIEIVYGMMNPGVVSKNVYFEGKEHLDEALAKGKGVIAVTAHFGNFPLMMLYCARVGYKTSAIVRTMRDEHLEKFLLKKRSECGLSTIYALPRNKCVSDTFKALKDNNIVFIPMDQNFGTGAGVFVEFFGRKAATATGPVIFAMRSGASILPMFIIRQSDGRHKIVIEKPLVLEEKEDMDRTLVYNIQKITALIEQYVRRYPHEWSWMHRRWKYKPYSMQFVPNC